MEYDVLDFSNKYELIASTTSFNREIMLPMHCRFCNEPASKTTFNNKSHAFPEFLGANDLISLDECDKCNSFFAKHESHLSKFLQPFITFNGIKGKRGIPVFQSRSIDGDKQTQTHFTNAGSYKLSLLVGNEDNCTFDYDKKALTINFRIPLHKPLLVYQALVKIALSLLPSHRIVKYKSVYEWIVNEKSGIHFYPVLFTTALKQKRFNGSFADLFELKPNYLSESVLPELTLILRFGNVVAQVFLPFTPDFLPDGPLGKNLELTLSPAHLFSNDLGTIAETLTLDYHFHSFDLSNPESVSINHVMHFQYEDILHGTDTSTEQL